MGQLRDTDCERGEELLEWINANGAVVGLLTFLFGLVLGHRFALGRDKRKEWNDVVDRVRVQLVKSLNYPPHLKVDRASMDALTQVAATISTKRGLQGRIEGHLRRHSELASAYQQDNTGGIFYTTEQTAAMEVEIQALLGIVSRD